ncbi:MAG: fumarate reductase iron-sulfur subunit [Deltaproteobacteria bacterium]|nr:fumarate reductase iron-sulfur subunit [Deltaproteobacteria bacterium]
MRSRKLSFSIFRYNPSDPDSQPRLQEFELDETPSMTLFTVLSRIREEDPSLQFDFVCRSAVCGSCGMLVNGKPRLACRTKTAELPRKTNLLPLPFFRLVGDLSVDTGTWFRELGKRVRSWVHTDKFFDRTALEERMFNSQARAIYELDRCIECGCCLGACATAQMRSDFLGAAGLARVARFCIDPRDQRSEREIFEVLGTDEGVFGCIGLLACQDFCPKNLPLETQISYLRRVLARGSLTKAPDVRESPTRSASL